jgi:hypothetical protein
LEATPDECLRDFVRYLDVDTHPERVLAFSERYGVLETCGHAGHWPGVGVHCEMCRAELEQGVTVRREPIAQWWFHMVLLRALLVSEAYRQRDDVPSGQEAWAYFLLWDWRHMPQWHPDVQREAFASWDPDKLALLNGFLWSSFATLRLIESYGLYLAPGLRLSEINDGPQVCLQVQVQGLFPLLLVQYSTAVSSGRGIYICGQCRTPFWPDAGQRKPWSKGRDTFCSDECHRASRAADARLRYARNHPIPFRRRKETAGRQGE